MTDQMDRRLQELVNHLAAAAPEAPPFPVAAPARRPIPAWALAAAGAAAILLIIGLPFILFGGGRSDDPVITSPTITTLPSSPTTLLEPPPTTLPGTSTTTSAAVPEACSPGGLLVRALPQDGAAGRVVTPLRFINVSGGPCNLDDPESVIGIGEDGEEVAAVLGTYVPIGPDTGPVLQAGMDRTMVLGVGTACDAGRPVGPAADTVRITLAGGDVTVPFSGDLGCMFSYAGFAEWLDVEATVTDQAVADAVRGFAADPSPANFSVLPLADSVVLTLGPDAGRSQPVDTLVSPQSWVFDTSFDGFRGYVGPFSALTFLAEDRPVQVSVGPHDHCASPPLPPYPDLEGLRQISIQPVDATSCLEWWTVDLFMTPDGQIAGVTLDLYGP